jgi:large subunit ribosomal protein L19
MNTDLINQVELESRKKSLPKIHTGDMVEIKLIVRDKKGEKARNQIFKGLVLAIKGIGLGKTMTVRKVSNGIGVEKILPLHSPNIEEITIVKKGKVKQSKIFYMRDRIGKKAMKVSDSDREIETVEEEIPVEPNIEDQLQENPNEETELESTDPVAEEEDVENKEEKAEKTEEEEKDIKKEETKEDKQEKEDSEEKSS